MFCGWDWGSTQHGVCVIDDDGVIVQRWLVRHCEEELATLFIQLAELSDPTTLPIAIERGEGLVVGQIAAAGHPVLMVEPAAFKAARPRWGSAGAKSDRGDAFMLADYARTDGHRLRRVEPGGPGHPGTHCADPGANRAGRGTHSGVEPVVGDPLRAFGPVPPWCSRN